MPRRTPRARTRLLAAFALPSALVGVGFGALVARADGGAALADGAWAAPPVLAAGILLAMSLLALSLALSAGAGRPRRL